MSSFIKVQKVCEYCGDVFIAKTTQTRYCSRRCNSKMYKSKVREMKIEKSNTKTREKLSMPLVELESKPYLSINETSILFCISKRTIYRMLERGEITAGKAGTRTIIRQTEMERIFMNIPSTQQITKRTKLKYSVLDCFSTNEILSLYGISESTLYDLFRRKVLTRIKFGWKTYALKTEVNELLNKDYNVLKLW